MNETSTFVAYDPYNYYCYVRRRRFDRIAVTSLHAARYARDDDDDDGDATGERRRTWPYPTTAAEY